MQTQHHADHYFLKAFGALVRRRRKELALTQEDVRAKVRDRLQQGDHNAAVSHFENGIGWIDAEVARQFFYALEFANADELAKAYSVTRSAVDGHTESFYRNRELARIVE